MYLACKPNARRAGSSLDPPAVSGLLQQTKFTADRIQSRSICCIWPANQIHDGLDLARTWPRGKRQIRFTSSSHLGASCSPVEQDARSGPDAACIYSNPAVGSGPDICYLESRKHSRRFIKFATGFLYVYDNAVNEVKWTYWSVYSLMFIYRVHV